MKTLACCWLALAASAFCWANGHIVLSFVFSGPAGIALGFKLGELSRTKNWSDAKILTTGFLILATAGLAAFLIMIWRAAMGN